MDRQHLNWWISWERPVSTRPVSRILTSIRGCSLWPGCTGVNVEMKREIPLSGYILEGGFFMIKIPIKVGKKSRKHLFQGLKKDIINL